METYDPVEVYTMFSGGHDSLVVTHLITDLLPEAKVCHINTGIGIPATRGFVRDTCQDHGLPLIERTPEEMTYEDFVLKHGFPGPASHRYAYSWLKERPLRTVIRDAKTTWKDRVLLITGVRRQESTRRMAHTQPIQRDGAKVWVAPCLEWTKLDVNDYIDDAGLERNPVVDLLHMSGECLCGAFARPGEFEEIKAWYPDVADRIIDLEARVEEAGQDRCRWGDRQKRHDDQAILDEFTPPMCRDCPRRTA